MQRGTLYAEYQSGGKTVRLPNWLLKYRTTEDGKVVSKTVTLCSRTGSQHHNLCDHVGEHRTEKSLDAVRNKIMASVNVKNKEGNSNADMSVVDFWLQRYLPYCEEVVLTGQPRKKHSTLRAYRQIWNQHLRSHFGETTLRQYEPHTGSAFLDSLTATQGKNTLKHIKALACSLFKRAVAEQRIKFNPWRDVSMPDDAIEPASTKHYTMEEAENIISALVDHVDCQLVMALACFLGLRPCEIAGLRWEDFDESVHIRRAFVRGKIGSPKTPESVASLPLIDQVRIPFTLWHQQCGKPADGWVFPANGGNGPIDLHNLERRCIRPHVTGGRCTVCGMTPEKVAEWKGLHAGRRGACTAIIEATGGNYAVAQALLRHKSMKTTLDVYKKAITPNGFKQGMAAFQKSLTEGSK